MTEPPRKKVLENFDVAHHHGARRRYRRRPLNADVAVMLPFQAEATAINISNGGIRIAVYSALAKNGLYLLRLWFTPNRYDEMWARAVWMLEQPDGWIVGLEFLEYLDAP